MFDLFKSEFKRFRLVALIAYFLQLLCWIFIGKMMILLKPEYVLHAALMLIALGSGVGIGAIQMLLHKRKNHWTYLIHRPMTLSHIHGAISAAAICIIFLGFILPFTSVIIYLDLMTNNVVDFRHYLMPLDMMLIAATAYFITSYVVLSPSKLVLISLFMLSYIMTRQNVEASYMLTVAAIFCGLSFYMAKSAFKVDLSVFSSKKAMIILSSVALQPLIFILMTMAQGVYYHLPLSIMSAHPGKYITTASFFSFKRSNSEQQFEQLLTLSQDSIAPSLKRQISLATFKDFSMRKRNIVTKGQLFTSDRSFEMWDKEQNLWVFSHDKMLFEGRHLRTDHPVGYMTISGFVENLADITPQHRFKQIPNIIDAQYIYTKQRLFKVDFEEKTVSLIYQLPTTQQFSGLPLTHYDITMLRTDENLIIFDKTDFNTAQSIVEPLALVPLPTDLENHIHVQISQMSDGYLMMFNSDHFFGFEQAGSQLMYLPHEENVRSLAQKRFTTRHYPRLITEQAFTLSPIVVNLLDFSLGRLLSTQKTVPQSNGYFWQRDYPAQIWWFCIGAALFSALLTLMIAKRLPMSTSNRWLWTLLSLVGALPALVAFLLLNDWRDAVRGDRHEELSHA